MMMLDQLVPEKVWQFKKISKSSLKIRPFWRKFLESFEKRRKSNLPTICFDEQSEMEERFVPFVDFDRYSNFLKISFECFEVDLGPFQSIIFESLILLIFVEKCFENWKSNFAKEFY